jgi:transcriptional regulator with XRE-family HTH domain
MLTAILSSQQAGLESLSTDSIRHQMLGQMRASKEYRYSFNEEAIHSRIVAQISALRRDNGWDLKAFAERLGKKLSWTYRLEDPNAPPPTIPSLLQIAATCDVGLDVRFRSFSELLDDAVDQTPKSFAVPSFDAELKSGAFSRTVRKRRLRRPRKKSKATTQSKVIPFPKHSLRRRRVGSIRTEVLKNQYERIGNRKAS